MAGKITNSERRTFIRRSLTLGGAALAGAGARANESRQSDGPPSWMTAPGKPFSNYGQPAESEKGVIRWIAANPAVPGNGVSWTPLQDLAGTITPNPLHFERHHNGVPVIDPAEHRLVIEGLVERRLEFSIEQLLRYPRESRICFIECGGNSSSGWQTQPLQSRVGHMHGLVSCSEWTGVRLSGLLHEAGIRDQANWLIAEGADAAGVVVSLPLSKATGDTLAALYQNGERLRPENGYPLRLVVPGWEGIVNLKWLRRLTLAREPLMSRFETAKYTDLQPDGIARQFSFEMGVKSVITEPSPGLGPDGAGHYEIRGLAWSGAGRISKVEVSVDAGETWEQARLQEPVLPASLTRFRIPWHWHGRRTILLSRAVDERGHQQPTRTELVNQHGAHQYYHYHAIVSWEVEAGGGVRHVYL